MSGNQNCKLIIAVMDLELKWDICTSHLFNLPSLECNNRHICQPWNATIDTCEHICNSNSVGNSICNVMSNGICNMAAIAFAMAAMVAMYW